MKGFFKVNLNASLTVEASFIMPICLFILMNLMIMSFDVYKETVDFIIEKEGMKYDGIVAFRFISAGKDLVGL